MDTMELYEVIGRMALKNAAKGRRITELLGVTNREVERRRTAERRVAELEERVTLLSGGPLVLTSDLMVDTDQFMRDWGKVSFAHPAQPHENILNFQPTPVPTTPEHRIQRSLDRLRTYTAIDEIGKPITPPAKSEPLVFGENWLD